MKKSKILMLLPAFLLVGCAKSINKEDATAKAKQINEYQAQHPVTEFKLEMSMSEDENGEKDESKVVYEFSEDKVYFHVNDETNDLYAYKKDSKYYIVNEKEKQYYEYGEEAKEAFDNSVKGQKASVASMFASYATVDIDGLITHYAPGVNAEIKYSTKGDGSLIIELSYKGEEAGMKGEMYGKAAWENYYPTELTFKSEASGSGQTMKMEMSAKFEYSVNPSYKDLSSGYTKLN